MSESQWGGGGQLWAGSGGLRPSTEKPVPLSHRGHKAHGSRRGSSKGEGLLISFSNHFLLAGWFFWFSVGNSNSRKTIWDSLSRNESVQLGAVECLPLNHGWKGPSACGPGSSQPPGRGCFFCLFLINLSLSLSFFLIEAELIYNVVLVSAVQQSDTHIYILFYILSHRDLSQDIEYSSLCSTVGPCCLSRGWLFIARLTPQGLISATKITSENTGLDQWFCWCWCEHVL